MSGREPENEENLVIGADYSMAELFSAAQLCKNLLGYSAMGDILNSGQDVHVYASAQVYGCSYDELDKSDERDEGRSLGKVENFGIWGGLGAAKLVLYAANNYGVDLSQRGTRDAVQFAKRVINTYKYTTFPECGEYLEWVGKQGYPWRVHHPITGFVRGGVGYCDGANTGFQSLTAWYGKTACAYAVMASYDPTSPLYGFKLWGFVHDELLMRGPASRAPEAADELARLMIKACDEVCPDYHIKTEPWVADVWSKFVKWPKGKDRDANGRLRVWRLNVAVREWRAELAAAQAEGNTKKALKLRKNLAAVGFAP